MAYLYRNDLNVTEDQVGDGIAEASTLGLKPGEWPNNVYVHAGNDIEAPVVEMFGWAEKEYSGHGEDAEIVAVKYSGPTGALTILND